MDTECNCDTDYRCDFPPCVADGEAEMAYYASIYATVPALDVVRQDCIDAGRPVAAMMLDNH